MRFGYFALIIACLFLTSANASHRTTDVFTIYLAPNGDDANDGLSRESAILSIERAQDVLMAAQPGKDVEIRVASGTYYDQRVRWRYTMPHKTISFMRDDDADDRPVFDGCPAPDAEPRDCRGGTWFTLLADAGERSNLRFHYLEVTRYGTAISFNGNRDADGRSNAGNRVYGSYFKDIGNVFNTDLSASTAAIRLVNSDDNQFANNHFVNIVNVGRGSRLIHALYVAHGSSDNTISRNRFENVSGDAIRLRDASNDNIIVRNRILRSGSAGFSDWYCDHEARSDCTKVAPECPSWGNVFRDNALGGSYQCRAMETVTFYQDDTTRGCPAPPPRSLRLRQSGNTEAVVQCVMDETGSASQ